ncbi:cold shock domain-containing protein [Candidatus Woesearchaeota archaeon]|nr:cold shock domain-containing protein [Candidatus Woesearchaeota archaeon]
MEGTVKWFDKKKGYGFISGDDGNEYFLHHSQLQDGAFLRENDIVTFESGKNEKGLQANNVSLKKKASERSEE